MNVASIAAAFIAAQASQVQTAVAAKMLGLSRSSLYRKLESLGIYRHEEQQRAMLAHRLLLEFHQLLKCDRLRPLPRDRVPPPAESQADEPMSCRYRQMPPGGEYRAPPGGRPFAQRG